MPTAREAYKHLRLPVIDDAFKSLHMLTVPSTLGPHRLGAGRYIITSRFRCRSFDRRYVVGALSTGRCLPAVAPRVLVMGDEVRSRSSPDNHFNSFQVTAPRITQESRRPRVSDRTMVDKVVQPRRLAQLQDRWRFRNQNTEHREFSARVRDGTAMVTGSSSP